MLASGTRLGPYEILNSVGAGGMGHVYAGRDTRLDRSVAIKVLPPHLSSNPDFKLRFEREARVISGLNHSNICTLYDIGHEQDLHYLVMEFCDGQSLAERLARGPLPIDQVLRYGIQIAAALDRAHRAGIVHRDLKPGNIMLTKAGAKLLDFGLAKPSTILGSGVHTAPGADDATEHKALTAEGQIVGTFQYMSPEQLEGREADARSDIFAFGAVLYEMITGKRAFEGHSKASLIATILDRDPRPISESQPLVPPPLERVARTCLAKDPDERWQSAHDLMREIEWIRDGVSSPALQAATQKRAIRTWAPWIAAAILAIAAATATWIVMESAKPARLVSAIAPPVDTQFVPTGDTGGPVTLSPDGKWATYVAFSKHGPNLWLQSLESGEAKILPGTEKAIFPFWSRDSRSIGFFSTGKLKVVEIEGSLPRIVADAPDARGGSWGPGDTILYTPNTQTAIVRVPANGGVPVPLTTIRPPYTTHRWPMLLPDGKHFIYFGASHGDPMGRDTAIFIASIDGKVNRKLLTATSHGVPYRDYILHVDANKLVARRIDGGEIVGEPVRIRNNVLSDPGTWRSIVSVSESGLLAYHEGGASFGSPLRWVDRTGKILSESPPRPLTDISLSPDGEKLALTLGDPKGAIYIQDIARGVETRLSFVDASARVPLWTPDGKNIIFSTVQPGDFHLYIKPADGSAPERLLLRSSQDLLANDVTPDGSLLIYAEGGGTNINGAIKALPLAGGAPRVVIDTPATEFNSSLSPDGRWIVYNEAAARTVYLAPFPGPGGKWQVSNEATVYGAWWSQTGKEIFYLTGDEIVSVEVSFQGGSPRLGAPKTLFPISVNTNNKAIATTRDGERFAIVALQPHGTGAATLMSNWDEVLD